MEGEQEGSIESGHQDLLDRRERELETLRRALSHELRNQFLAVLLAAKSIGDAAGSIEDRDLRSEILEAVADIEGSVQQSFTTIKRALSAEGSTTGLER